MLGIVSIYKSAVFLYTTNREVSNKIVKYLYKSIKNFRYHEMTLIKTYKTTVRNIFQNFIETLKI